MDPTRAADRLLIFAKVPTPGRVKTRLQPVLGAEGCAAVYSGFVADIVARARVRAAGGGPRVIVYHDPADAGPFLHSLGVELRPQVGPDLGARMAHAFREQTTAGPGKVVLIGCDSPDLPPSRIEQAFAALDRVRLVLGPAVDGGYCLIGAREAPEPVLAGMPWGATDVLERTLAAARAAGWSLALLDPWYDVDRPADLAFLRTHLDGLLQASGDDRCPRTRGLLAGLGALA